MRPIVKTGIKVGLTLVALETAARNGIWKDSQAATAGYENVKESFVGSLVPQVKPYLDKIPLPNIPALQVDWREKWNSGVIYVFAALANMPSRTTELAADAWEKLSKATVNK